MALTNEDIEYVRAAESRINDIALSVKCKLHPFVVTAIFSELKTMMEVGKTRTITTNKPFVSED